MTKKQKLIRERQEMLRSLAEQFGFRVENALLPEFAPRPELFSPEARRRRARDAAKRVQ